MNQICKSVKTLFEKYLPVKPAVIAIASLSVLSLTANAATIEIWLLDNFFSNVVNGVAVDRDGSITQTNITVGDTVRWTNKGFTVHTTTNANILEDGILEGDLWDSDALNVGETFSHTFNDVGEFPYLCTIHGGGDMEGRIIVAAGGPDPTPTGTETPGLPKRFSFECDKEVTEGTSGIETLVLNVGETVSCVLKLAADENDQCITNFVRGNNSVVSIVSDDETADGELIVEIEGQEAGMVWTAWGIGNFDSKRGLINRFRKADFDQTDAWGFVIEVVE